MPEISRFLGVIIRMFFAENGHNLIHFHATYNEHSAVFSIDPLELIEGKLPPRISPSYIWDCNGMGISTSKRT
jgi:Domain of unknown function (DUF4160)